MIIVLLADAIGYHYCDDQTVKDRLSQLFETIVPAESFLAYSAGIHASIWTSSHIKDHGIWLNYFLKSFPNRETEINHLAWRLQSLITFVHKRLVQNPSLYYIPKEISSSFGKIEYDFTSPFYHKELSSLFWELTANEVKFQFSVARKIEQLSSVISKNAVNILFLDEFDALGHRLGPKSPMLKKRILELVDRLETIKRMNADSLIILFSDHGMSEIRTRVDFLEQIRFLDKNGIKLGRDYVFFLDGTLIRFWLRRKEEKAEQALRETAADFPGHVLSEEEKQRYGLPVSNKFGDLVFLADSGTEIFPNFFHPLYASYEKGIHGYAPESSCSFGIFAATSSLNSRKISLLDVAPTLSKYLGLEIPKSWRGTAYGLQ